MAGKCVLNRIKAIGFPILLQYKVDGILSTKKTVVTWSLRDFKSGMQMQV
jgi:hypothetical protein